MITTISSIIPKIKGGYVMKKPFWKSTAFLAYGTQFIGLVLMFVGGSVLQQIYGDNVPEYLYYAPIALFAFSGVIGHFCIVVRKEMPRPGLKPVTGMIAQFWGCLALLIFVPFFLFCVYSLLMGLLGG